MEQCKEIQAQISFYLDDELQGSERAAVCTHLRGCQTCRRIFEEEEQLFEAIRGARPLYNASPELRGRVEQILSDTAAPHEPSAGLRRRIRSYLWQKGSNSRSLISARSLMVAAVIILAPVAAWLASRENGPEPNPPSEFALMAVDTHQRHLRKQLPLEITSDVPVQISEWFTGKVPFSLKLPNYQESSGQEKLYNLEGARLVGYKNDYAAYVAYKMRREPISLLVTSEAVAQPSGGEEIVSRGLRFHYDSIQGFKVITWSDRGLTYALVSDLEERGQQSCIVCHQGTRDQDFIETLKPKQISRIWPRVRPSVF